MKEKITELGKRIDILTKLTTQRPFVNSTPRNKSFRTPINHHKQSLTKRLILETPTVTELLKSAEEMDSNHKMAKTDATLAHSSNRSESNIENNNKIENVDTKITQEEINKCETQRLNTVDKILDCKTNTTYKKPIKPKIHILGDQRCKGIAAEMIESRKSKWNDNYTVTGYCKPQASTLNVLTSCKDVLKESDSKNDIIVLILGSNDTKPYEFVFELCNALNMLKEHKVLIVKVAKNNHINSNLQNYYIKLLCNHYNRTKFIEVDSRNRKELCDKLNTEIDSDDYKYRFLNFKNKAPIAIDNNEDVKNKITVTTRPKKGTIPYYFQIQTTNPVTGARLSQNQINTVKPKKGTIPYFFQKNSTTSMRSPSRVGDVSTNGNNMAKSNSFPKTPITAQVP